MESIGLGEEVLEWVLGAGTEDKELECRPKAGQVPELEANGAMSGGE